MPDLDNSYSIMDNSLYEVEYINKEFPNEDISIYSSFDVLSSKETLKNLIDKIKILEKEIELLKNNN